MSFPAFLYLHSASLCLSLLHLSSSAEVSGPSDSMLAFTANAKTYSAYVSATGVERKLKKSVADYRKSVKLGGLFVDTEMEIGVVNYEV